MHSRPRAKIPRPFTRARAAQCGAWPSRRRSVARQPEWREDLANHFIMNDINRHFSSGLQELAALATQVADELGPQLEVALALVRETVGRGGTLFFCGNGGSAADAQHMATEYVVRYLRNRRAYPAIA